MPISLQVIDEVGEPVHLIGHSFGGLVTLAKALTKAPPPLSIITFEGNPVYSRPDQGRFDWKDHLLDVGQQFEQAYASGDPDAAALIIDYWGGHGFFQSMPDKVRDFCRSTAYTNILDWRAASGFTPKMSEFSSLNIPASLVRGELANAAIVEITGLLEQAIPDAKMHVVDGAGHFLISTHPQQCAAIIDQHMHHFFGGQQR